ncbi:MAG: hypothetical protein ACXVCY_09250 [Pseudobdellovibrionaceae bacterium]
MFRSLLAMAVSLGMASAAFATDKSYYEIKKVKVTDVTEQYARAGLLNDYPAGLNQNCEVADKKVAEDNPTDPVKDIGVVVDEIINIGKKIFAIIEAGRPVVNLKFDNANALPKGLTCWSDLAGWKKPQSKVYNIQYFNGFNMTVVDFSYRVIFTAGGTYNGIGKYITNASFQPANLNVAWGFNFDASATIPSVFNTGSKAEPVAGMQMNMEWKVTNVATHIQHAESFYVSGDNTMEKLP